MCDLIARCLARLFALLFPACGTHRATPEPEPVPAVPAPPLRRPLRPLPALRSPYAHQAATQRPFVDTINPVRPYLTTPPRRWPQSPEQRAQAERRWALDMALRGLDVGPSTIHGVHVMPGSRTSHVPMTLSA